MKVVVDVFGGDYAPKEIVDGCIKALEKNENLKLVLAGDKDKLTEQLINTMYYDDRLEILHAPDIITNNESPAMAIRHKTSSSIVVAYDYLRQTKDAIGLVSAGSTGATLTGAVLKLGRIDGISRPALAPIMPTLSNGQVMMLDVGANVDCKSVNLVHFALMGSIYMQSIGVNSPKVALLNVGTEDEKGNELSKEVFELLKNDNRINFVGNVEARDVLKGNVDVVVTDGFAGNVCLKSIEGTAEMILSILKSEIKSSFMAKIGYAIGMKKPFKHLKQKMDYRKFGGAPLLGVSKIVIKCHGNSRAESICTAIEQVMHLHQSKLIETIESTIEEKEME